VFLGAGSAGSGSAYAEQTISAGTGIAVTPGASGITITNVGAGSVGAVVLVSEVVTSGSQASVTFSSISATWRDLIVVVRGRSAVAALNDEIRMQFNSDTASNYWTQLFDYDNGASGAIPVNETSVRIGIMTGNTGTANTSSMSEARIGDYRGTTFEKATIATSSAQWGASNSTMYGRLAAGHWRSTAAITSVKVFPGTGPFLDGTVVSLYGSY
jgi:hypothetical protein